MSLKQALLCVKSKSEYPYQTELSELLKEPKDIIDAVEKSKESGDHAEIHKILTNRNINLRFPIKEEDKTRTIARKILEDAVNGNKIVKKELDDHVKELDDKKDSINYAVEVDFEGILCKDSFKQTMVVYDLLDLRAEDGNDNTQPFTNLIKHPVIALLIAKKWGKTRWYFYAHSLMFITFLVFYSSFIIYLFNRPEVYCSKLQKVLSQNPTGIGGTLFFPDDVSGT